MNDLVKDVFGSSEDLEWWQMSARAVVVFILAIMYVRLSGRRSFGMRSAFDNTIVILLGAILARAVVGASPFFPTLAASLTLVLMHRLFAWVSIHSHAFGKLIKGSPIPLYKDGKLVAENMSRSLISEHDLKAGLRDAIHTESLDGVETVLLDRDGRISVIEKKNIA